MEVLSRQLRRLTEFPHFSYHPKCSRLGLTHLIFADDLMVFVRGDVPSVQAVSQSLSLFATWSGLSSNLSKTNIYFGGVARTIKDLILLHSEFAEGQFPFRYLGIPLNSAKLSREMFHMLIQKIQHKLLHWATHLLSYAGKVQLIKTCIFGLENFWCSCILLPRNIIKLIEKLCKQFLWGYTANHRRPIWMSWKHVCRPKGVGGFDIREILSWNKTLLLRWVWKLYCAKDTMWCNWVKQYLLKGGNWETVQPISTSSWMWKCILNVRDEFIRCAGRIDNAKTCFTNWTENGRLVLKHVYDFFRGDVTRIGWSKVVWDCTVMPKHSFFGVMVLQNFIPTVDKICQRGIVMVNRCNLCYAASETVDHLYFDCPFSHGVLKQIFIWNGLHRRPLCLHREMVWQQKYNRGKSWRKRWLRCSLLATLYAIWQERNNRIFNGLALTVPAIVFRIKYEVSVRMYAFKCNYSEEDIVHCLVG